MDTRNLCQYETVGMVGFTTRSNHRSRGAHGPPISRFLDWDLGAAHSAQALSNGQVLVDTIGIAHGIAT